jgi:non-ribosomal peptide synthetase component F
MAVLGRRSGRSDVTIGTTYSRRSDPAFSSVIGPLADMVVLRVDISGDLEFSELLSRVREVALDAYEAREVPLATVVDLVGGHHDASRTPLFGVVVDLVARPRTIPVLAGLTVTELPDLCVGSKHDLSIAFDNSGDALQCMLVWDTALYERATMERLGVDLRAAILEAAGES